MESIGNQRSSACLLQKFVSSVADPLLAASFRSFFTRPLRTRMLSFAACGSVVVCDQPTRHVDPFLELRVDVFAWHEQRLCRVRAARRWLARFVRHPGRAERLLVCLGHQRRAADDVWRRTRVEHLHAGHVGIQVVVALPQAAPDRVLGDAKHEVLRLGSLGREQRRHLLELANAVLCEHEHPSCPCELLGVHRRELLYLLFQKVYPPALLLKHDLCFSFEAWQAWVHSQDARPGMQRFGQLFLQLHAVVVWILYRDELPHGFGYRRSLTLPLLPRGDLYWVFFLGNLDQIADDAEVGIRIEEEDQTVHKLLRVPQIGVLQSNAIVVELGQKLKLQHQAVPLQPTLR
mmetsp:Transcript_21994/g.55438  ORF Transcript_21994/g.55438 Transcript_21994/m.55438 type:complete len:347 (+) Transcript_21994:240-1280(+)